MATTKPVEVAGVAGAGLVATAYELGADRRTLVLIGMAAAFGPATWRYLVASGGISGLLRALWRGR